MVRQNGMNQALRIVRFVHGSLVPVMRAAEGGFRTGTMVSATKPVVGFRQFVFLRLRLIDIAERALVDEGEMRVVERILHHSQRRASPRFVELMDAPEGAVFLVSEVRDVGDRLAETDPDIAVARPGVEVFGFGLGDRLLEGKLRDVHELAGPVVFPAMVAAHDMALLDPAFGQFGRPVAAAILERRRFARRVEEDDNVLSENAKRLRSILEFVERQCSVPEIAQDRLAGVEHGGSLAKCGGRSICARKNGAGSGPPAKRLETGGASVQNICRTHKQASASTMSKTATKIVPKTETRVQRPRLHKVILFNDDYTPRDFVVEVLKGVFRLNETQALNVMVTAHRKGVCVVAVFVQDVAETKAARGTEAGAAKGYPLRFGTEPEE